MSILTQITEKPWLPIDDNVVEFRWRSGFSVSNSRVGLRIFLVVVSVIFFLLTIAYAERIVNVTWRPMPQPELLWLSTGLLVLASAGMQWAQTAVIRGGRRSVNWGLLAGGVFAFLFVGSQLLAWRQLNAIPVFDMSNPAIGFFYLITGMHGVHILGGLFVWCRTGFKMVRGAALKEIGPTIGLCTTYWHYLLAVWLLLFGLLFSGNDNLAILLSICGLK